VYLAIDVQHDDMVNDEWIEYSRQDPEDAPRLLAFVQRLMESWSDFFQDQQKRTEEERKEHLASFSNLNMCIKNYVHGYVNRLLGLKYDGRTATVPPIIPQFVALKRINPTSSPERLLDEISFLRELGGKHNVVPVVAGLRYQDQVIVVFPYFHSPDFREYLCELNAKDISCYMRLLFEALAHIHSAKVIHRDIKPSNFLFSPQDQRGILVDFGLAQVFFYLMFVRGKDKTNTIKIRALKKQKTLKNRSSS
jgi:serine/threonine protein kinase